MKKKGFTLIELLAVIVVLAIIAIIATPMVLNTIEEARKGAAQSSAYTYISEVETKLATYMLKNNGNSYTSGKQSIANIKVDLGTELKGDTPSDGYVCIGLDGTVTKASIKINNYVISYDGKDASISENNEIENIDCNYIAKFLDKAKSLVYDENGVCKTDGSTYNYMGGCYIKGASTNNYIWYNGFMWRIMGINSDNTVRMITDEGVTALSYGHENRALTYTTNEGYIHDWLNEYFYNHLNSTKSIIKEGSYFCSESTNAQVLTEGRINCTSDNVITTKIGLMSVDEYLLSGTLDSYLNIMQIAWTLTPFNENNNWYMTNYGNIKNDVSASQFAIRPVINVVPNATITSGDGTSQDFYILGEDKNISITGKLNEKVTSGEYVTLEGHTYRVVRKTNDGVKLILDGFYEENNIIYEMNYNEVTGDNSFVLTSGIGAKLNGIEEDNRTNVITWLGLSDSNKIVETTYYQGEGVTGGSSYITMLSEVSPVTSKIGLIQVGDILASQSSTLLTENYIKPSNINNTKSYWSMTKSKDDTYNRYISFNGNTNAKQISKLFAVRPVITVRNDLNITGGNGTWKNPYQI